LAAITAKRAEKRKRKKELQTEAKRKNKLEKLLPVKNDGSFFEMFQAQMAKLGEGTPETSAAETVLTALVPLPATSAQTS